MSINSKNKDNSISYHQLTPSLRRKRGGGTVMWVEQGGELGGTAPSQESVAKYITRAMQRLFGWMKNLNKIRDGYYRCFQAYLRLLEIWELPENTWIVIPYNDIKINTQRYSTMQRRYYSQRRGVYWVYVYFWANMGVGTDLIGNPEIAVFLNGEYYATLDYIYTESRIPIIALRGGTLVPLQCGDYIDIRLRHFSFGVNTQIQVFTPIYSYLNVNYEGSHYIDTQLNVPLRLL